MSAHHNAAAEPGGEDTTTLGGFPRRAGGQKNQSGPFHVRSSPPPRHRDVAAAVSHNRPPATPRLGPDGQFREGSPDGRSPSRTAVGALANGLRRLGLTANRVAPPQRAQPDAALREATRSASRSWKNGCVGLDYREAVSTAVDALERLLSRGLPPTGPGCKVRISFRCFTEPLRAPAAAGWGLASAKSHACCSGKHAATALSAPAHRFRISTSPKAARG